MTLDRDTSAVLQLCVGSSRAGTRKLTVVFSPASDYFSAYLGEYRNVLSALEALNSAVLAAMDKTKLVRMGPWEGGGAGGCRTEAVVTLTACLALNWADRGSKCGTSQIDGVPCVCFGCLHVQQVLLQHSMQHSWRRGSQKRRVELVLRCSGSVFGLFLIGLWQSVYQQLFADHLPGDTVSGSITVVSPSQRAVPQSSVVPNGDSRVKPALD